MNTNYKDQQVFVTHIKKLNEDYFNKTGNRKKFYISTYGCQMNVRDSETLFGMLTDMGYIHTDTETNADLVVYNTCCVRENAENKVYGNLGFLKTIKKNKPNLKIVLCGCMMQQDSVIQNIKKSHRHVDVIFGTYNIQRFPELLKSNIDCNEMIIDIWETHDEIIEDLPSVRENPFKASVNIMYGCNNFCTYCIVPYVRGRERSREVQDILNEIQTLANDGVKEILLLGQNVNSYGLYLKQPTKFATLLEKIVLIDGIERIRFVTSHPKDLSDELLEVMAKHYKICKHLHLPFQSGSDKILDKMNRNYTKQSYLAIIEKAKKLMPFVGLSTDIIVGFPAETEEDFLDTLDVVDKCSFSAAFTFIYSKRIGTPAANMKEVVDEDIVKDRFSRLLNKVNQSFYDFNTLFIGKTVKVLVEEINAQNNELLSGRTEQNTLVHFKISKDVTAKEVIGTIVDVKIISNKSFYLVGEL